MIKSTAKSPEEYLETLPPDRREALSKLREVILANLPQGYIETINWGMLSYEIPLERYPTTYNKRPLALAALASQKNFMTLYLMTVYGDKGMEEWFKAKYTASGKKLDMGQSCVHFRKIEDLPLEVIAETIGRVSVDEYIARYERARGKKK